MKNKKIKRPILWKLVLVIGIPLFVIYSVILVVNYFQYKDSYLDQMKEYLKELTSHNAADLNSQFIQIAEQPKSIATMLGTFKKPDVKELYSLISKTVESNPSIYGITVAFEPYSFNKKIELFSPYIYKDNDKILQVDLAENYNYLHSDWYLIPELLNDFYWTEPYFDEGGGNIFMCTYSFPIRKDGKFMGIVTADISLEDLKSRMKNIKILAGYTFIISRYGTYIYHPNEKDIMRETIFSKAEMYDFPAMREFGRNMISGRKGVESFDDPITNSKQWLVYSPISSTEWTFAAIVPEKEILEKVNEMVIHQLSIMIIGLCVIILVIIWAAYKITNPIRKLAGLAEQLATGDLTVQMTNIKGRDEIHELAMVFNKMVIDLKHYIHDMTEATKAREAVESELRIARNIQESLLPRVFPPFPDRKEFNLYAKIIPAKEVAGDFYDFFFLDDNQLALIMADVSGKGVSAGLFMAVTRTLIKTVCQKDVSPSEVLRKANYILCQDNDACMFTTLFLAIYNVKSGKVSYANAGHNYPVILSRNGEWRMLDSFNDTALGIIEDQEYRVGETTINIDDCFVLYTDGVTEATSPEKELYGEDRFIKKLIKNLSLPVDGIINKINEDLAEFQQGTQFDDITLMILRRNI